MPSSMFPPTSFPLYCANLFRFFMDYITIKGPFAYMSRTRLYSYLLTHSYRYFFLSSISVRVGVQNPRSHFSFGIDMSELCVFIILKAVHAINHRHKSLP